MRIILYKSIKTRVVGIIIKLYFEHEIAIIYTGNNVNNIITLEKKISWMEPDDFIRSV